mgnify:CR=1 FL=1
MTRLPPLNALKAFESAGRHLSFSRAANELNVTPGAISQQIKTLEEFLETRLFRRRNRVIVLTDAGQLCLPLVTQGFNCLSEAVDSVCKLEGDGPLMISSAPSFISKWLIPRLGKFQKRHPGIDVRIDASTRLVDFDYEDIDVGIRFGADEFAGLDSSYLFSFDLIPVCKPALLKSGAGLSQLSDLRHHTLLHSKYDDYDASWPDWAMWLATAGAGEIDSSHGLFFNQSEMLMDAAIEGQGVALVSSVMAAGEIEAGRLVQPFETRLPVRLSYRLVTSKSKARRARVCAFRAWILEESAYLREDQGS